MLSVLPTLPFADRNVCADIDLFRIPIDRRCRCGCVYVFTPVFGGVQPKPRDCRIDRILFRYAIRVISAGGEYRGWCHGIGQRDKINEARNPIRRNSGVFHHQRGRGCQRRNLLKHQFGILHKQALGIVQSQIFRQRGIVLLQNVRWRGRRHEPLRIKRWILVARGTGAFTQHPSKGTLRFRHHQIIGHFPILTKKLGEA
mmetsp:Transcript_8320/g.8496  ORF Transcript_8320/g.8496 Transcript_8320/m.8496 type:complete len:200 (+) Transcript_8320:350-949(+)